ncbi:MAG: hypothetical protein ACK2UL_10190 [Anaerolineae bacterium]
MVGAGAPADVGGGGAAGSVGAGGEVGTGTFAVGEASDPVVGTLVAPGPAGGDEPGGAEPGAVGSVGGVGCPVAPGTTVSTGTGAVATGGVYHVVGMLGGYTAVGVG